MFDLNAPGSSGSGSSSSSDSSSSSGDSDDEVDNHDVLPNKYNKEIKVFLGKLGKSLKIEDVDGLTYVL